MRDADVCGETGSAMVEFVVLVCLLLLPVVYLITVLGRVQAAAFGTEAAARQSAVMVAGAADQSTARARSALAVQAALADQGFSPSADGAPVVGVTCTEARCQDPQSVVEVTVTQSVMLPLPRMLRDVWPLRVTVSSTQTAVSDRFRE